VRNGRRKIGIANDAHNAEKFPSIETQLAGRKSGNTEKHTQKRTTGRDSAHKWMLQSEKGKDVKQGGRVILGEKDHFQELWTRGRKRAEEKVSAAT